jgi:hypothetical protein
MVSNYLIQIPIGGFTSGLQLENRWKEKRLLEVTDEQLRSKDTKSWRAASNKSPDPVLS